MKSLWSAAPVAACVVLAPSLALAQTVSASAEFAPPDPSTLSRPALDFTPTANTEADYDKYFYFHRADTSFEQAYEDVRECDALASGSSIYLGADDVTMAAVTANYGALAGGIGGAIGSAVADAIFGSAARREQRRTNIRTCMGFKGYQRYGLPRDLWTSFNFEEGLGRKREPVRLKALAVQALVASGSAPQTKALGL